MVDCLLKDRKIFPFFVKLFQFTKYTFCRALLAQISIPEES